MEVCGEVPGADAGESGGDSVGVDAEVTEADNMEVDKAPVGVHARAAVPEGAGDVAATLEGDVGGDVRENANANVGADGDISGGDVGEYIGGDVGANVEKHGGGNVGGDVGGDVGETVGPHVGRSSGGDGTQSPALASESGTRAEGRPSLSTIDEMSELSSLPPSVFPTPHQSVGAIVTS